MGIAAIANGCKLNADFGGFLSFDHGSKSDPGSLMYNKNVWTQMPYQHTHYGDDWTRRKFDTEPSWKRFEDAEK